MNNTRESDRFFDFFGCGIEYANKRLKEEREGQDPSQLYPLTLNESYWLGYRWAHEEAAAILRQELSNEEEG